MKYLVTMNLTFFPAADCTQAEKDERFPATLAAKWKDMTVEAESGELHLALNQMIFDERAGQIAKDVNRPLSDILSVNAFTDLGWVNHGAFHEGRAPVFASTPSSPNPQEWTFLSATNKTIHVGAHAVAVP